MSSHDMVVYKVNEVYLKISCEDSIAAELHSFFEFEVPGAKFTPQYRNRLWNGKIYLFNRRNHQIYHGLTAYINSFAEARGYKVAWQPEAVATNNISIQEAVEFASSLNIHSRNQKIEVRDYQIMAFTKAMRYGRKLLLSPTASGKSLIAYLIVRYLEDMNGLIIVPTTSLVEQLYKDFADYSSHNGWEVEENVHRIYSGREKNTDKRITISTWQSLYKMDAEYFDSFDFVIGDEAHQFKAKSLTSILTKLVNCPFRIGMTGTLDGTQTHRLVLEGLFGPVEKVVSTSELIEKKQLASFGIKALVLKYPDHISKTTTKFTYPEEIDFLIGLDARNKFIKNLALSLSGNTLILYQFVEKHGEILHKLIEEKCENRKCFFVHGGVDADEREQIRSITEAENDAIIVASYGTFSTGINIRNLHNIVFASPSKSRIRNLQSIGRGLRLSESKEKATLFDIVDDLRYKGHENFALKHFVERVKIYDDEKFDWKMYNIDIKV